MRGSSWMNHVLGNDSSSVVPNWLGSGVHREMTFASFGEWVSKWYHSIFIVFELKMHQFSSNELSNRGIWVIYWVYSYRNGTGNGAIFFERWDCSRPADLLVQSRLDDVIPYFFEISHRCWFGSSTLSISSSWIFVRGHWSWWCLCLLSSANRQRWGQDSPGWLLIWHKGKIDNDISWAVSMSRSDVFNEWDVG